MNRLEQAIELHHQGDLSQAERLYLSHLQSNPRDAEALRLLGMLYWQQESLEHATHFLERAYALGSPSARLLGNLGLIKQQKQQFDEAISFYRQSLALEPNAVSLSNLGVLLRHKKEYGASEAVLSRAHALLPNEESVLLNLCTTLRLMNKNRHALEHLNRFCETIEPSAFVCSERARLHLELDEKRLAEHWIQKALALNTQHPSIWINLALVRKAGGAWEAALDALDQALNLRPLMPEVYVQFSQILHRLRHTEQALEACEAGLQFFSEDLALNKEMISVLSELERFEDAERLTEQLLQSHDDSDLWLHKGFLSLERHALTEAAIAFENCLRLEPQHAQAQHFLDVSYGRIPDVVSSDYVRGVFDDYAERFDQHLLRTLQYQVPQIIQEILMSFGQKWDVVVDLGCGTGLLGPVLKTHANQLLGVDISPKMIAQARKRHVYDVLETGEIEHYLTVRSGFDLIVAGDVFIYLGRLNGVLGAVFSALNSEGLCVFTIEATAEPTDDVVLGTSGRFQHSMSHVKNILKAHPFHVLEEKWVKLRQEGDQWVSGIAVVLQKP